MQLLLLGLLSLPKCKPMNSLQVKKHVFKPILIRPSVYLSLRVVETSMCWQKPGNSTWRRQPALK